MATNFFTGLYNGWKLSMRKCDYPTVLISFEMARSMTAVMFPYTDERAEKMLFSEEPMGEENIFFYADLSNKYGH